MHAHVTIGSRINVYLCYDEHVVLVLRIARAVDVVRFLMHERANIANVIAIPKW